MTGPSMLDAAAGQLQALTSRPDLARVLVPKLKAIADETRLTLLLLIAERPRTVKELQEATGLSQTLVSHHLGPLRDQELVSMAPRGRSNVYSLCCEALTEPVQLLVNLAAAESGDGGGARQPRP